jgi:acetylornithine deacetylase/succinyl-diaminopimelate desuccinylase-like protein
MMKISRTLSLVTFVGLILLVTQNSSAQKSNSKTAKTEQVKSFVTSYEKYIDDNNEAHLKEFIELVSIPSISSIPANKPDVAKAGQWIVNKLKSIGMPTAQLLPTDGNPLVYGSWDKAPGKPTVLIYAHYDVQPVKESEWVYPPFAPVVKDGRIYGRGTSDDKSGVMISIWAVEAMLKKDGKLPVNVKFLFEGEEEIGSPNFKNFLEKNKELLRTDFAVSADDAQYSDTVPAITLSTRGAAQLEFSVKTANTDAHSGQFGGKTPNSVVAMSQIISSLFDKAGNVAVEGFYDKVLPITTQQKETIKRIPYDPANDMKILGTTAEVGDATFSPLERVWYRPTLEVIGMQGGYTAAEGHSNIIPGNAMARITCRLVNNQNGKEIIDLIVKHINKNCPVGAAVTYKFKPGYASPMTTPSDTKAFNYVSNALLKIYNKEPLKLSTGGTGGAMISFKESLGVYAYSMGFLQSDEKWHASNEFLRISSIRKGQLVYCYYLQHIADEESREKMQIKMN